MILYPIGTLKGNINRGYNTYFKAPGTAGKEVQMKKLKKLMAMILAAATLTACAAQSTGVTPERVIPPESETATQELATIQVLPEKQSDPAAQTEPATAISFPSEESPSETGQTKDPASATLIIRKEYVGIPLDPSVIPPYSGSSAVDLAIETNLNELWDEIGSGYIYLSAYDDLGRCGSAVVHATKDIMPTGERESTGDAKPSGWVQNKYPGIVDSDPPYIYNRSHLLAWALCSLTSEPENLITGTRYFNTKAMLPTELEVIRYVEAGGEVLYRVTPVFTEDNLLADGVLMEAISKDGNLKICRFAYNVQPGIEIDYRTGDNRIEGVQSDETETTASAGRMYVLNTSSHKFHDPSCKSVNDIKEKNRTDYTGTREDLIEMGYSPCKRCNP